MRRALGHKDGLRLERLENMAGSGIPDVLCIRNGIIRFVELKVARCIPARASTRLLGDDGLRLDQRNWLLDWTKHGGVAYVVIGIHDSPFHMVMEAKWADEINEMPLSTLKSFAKVAGNSPEFWQQFMRECL